jgi:hypothetical protein
LASAAAVSVLIVALATLILLATLSGLLCLLTGLLIWVLALLATAAALIALLVLLSALRRILFICHLSFLNRRQRLATEVWQRRSSFHLHIRRCIAAMFTLVLSRCAFRGVVSTDFTAS